MKGILTNHQKKNGARYHRLHICDTDLLFFPPNMFWAENMEANETHGNICLSKPVGNDYQYDSVGTWVNVQGTFRLTINGVGIFTMIDNGEQSIELKREIATHLLQAQIANVIANSPFAGVNTLRDCLSSIT
jgi:hypothetical protein